MTNRSFCFYWFSFKFISWMPWRTWWSSFSRFMSSISISSSSIFKIELLNEENTSRGGKPHRQRRAQSQAFRGPWRWPLINGSETPIDEWWCCRRFWNPLIGSHASRHKLAWWPGRILAWNEALKTCNNAKLSKDLQRKDGYACFAKWLGPCSNAGWLCGGPTWYLGFHHSRPRRRRRGRIETW